MDERTRELLRRHDRGELPTEALQELLSAELRDVAGLQRELEQAHESRSSSELEDAVQLILASPLACLQLLNELLVSAGHRHHQVIAKRLQGAADPTTIPYARQALAMGFEHLAYTCSESGVIAKWFSWLLFAIGTPEAIEVLEEFAESADPEVAAEMRHRLATFDTRR